MGTKKTAAAQECRQAYKWRPVTRTMSVDSSVANVYRKPFDGQWLTLCFRMTCFFFPFLFRIVRLSFFTHTDISGSARDRIQCGEMTGRDASTHTLTHKHDMEGHNTSCVSEYAACTLRLACVCAVRGWCVEIFAPAISNIL